MHYRALAQVARFVYIIDMKQDTQVERIKQINRCMDELADCRNSFATASDPLMPLLGQMDWLDELHTQIHSEAL